MATLKRKRVFIEAVIKILVKYFFSFNFLNTKIKRKFEIQINGIKNNKNLVNGPKIKPREKTARLGNIMIGIRYFFEQFLEDATKSSAFTKLPVKIW